MKTVLVSGGSGIVGYGILRSLRMAAISLRLVSTSIYDDSVAPAFSDAFELAPRTDDPGYFDWLVRIIDKHAVDILIPGIEQDVFSWNLNRVGLEKTGVRIVLNTSELIELTRDKWYFYSRLKESAPDISIPTTLSANFKQLKNTFGFPLLLKPRRGYGSKGIVKIHDESTLITYKNDIGGRLMIQPWIGSDDEEYSIAAFGDGDGGYCNVISLKRKLSAEGFTDRAIVVDSAPFETLLSRLCVIFRPVGPTNFQFRRHESTLRLLEINPRISSSTSIRAAFGYNEPVMALAYFFEGLMPGQPNINKGRAVRYTDEIIYEDWPDI